LCKPLKYKPKNLWTEYAPPRSPGAGGIPQYRGFEKKQILQATLYPGAKSVLSIQGMANEGFFYVAMPVRFCRVDLFFHCMD
jgi:hypothetical protein